MRVFQMIMAVLFCAAPGLTYTLAHARGKLHGSKTD